MTHIQSFLDNNGVILKYKLMMYTNAILAVQRDDYRAYNIVIGDNIDYLIRIININIKSYL